MEQLSATLKAVEEPTTSPQEREAVISSIQEVTGALTAIDDPETPRQLRQQLIGVVRQVASTLEVSQASEVAPEVRTAVIASVKQATSALRMIRDPETPLELREQLTLIVKQLTAAMGQQATAARVERHDQAALDGGRDVGRAVNTISHPQTSPQQRKKLAQIAAKASSSLVRLGGSSASEEDRAKAHELVKDQTDQLNRDQVKAVAAQDIPDVPLGEAAVVCTNRIFETIWERALSVNLSRLLPQKWKIEGVQDFWKSWESQNDALEVHVQLQNDEDDHAPFDIAQLTTRLAVLVPADKLLGILGVPGLHCLQAAWQLDRQSGVTAGGWLEMAKDKKGNGQ
ncbi:hypothetical protein [Streptomyces sp. NPDC002187]|uniref:hypothetical protein n=1 Tax=Streptomyces sp. NPDC002187 TaxID=3364637 RepID=UPI0036CB9FF9